MEEDERRAMIATNLRQQDFYESRFESSRTGPRARERAANRATHVWTLLRRRIQRLRAEAGVDDELMALHREWLGDVSSARVLDLGCFTGNRLSLWIAESAAEYLGIDLSQQAIAELNRKLTERGLSRARAVQMDFLANDWEDGRFDVVYAYSVLHHFRDLDVVLRELQRVVAPGGIVITMDPMQTDPLNRLARRLYRPFQTDREWEFPFTRATLTRFSEHFDLVAIQGLQGLVKLAYPLLLISPLDPIGRRVATRLRVFDWRFARSPGIPLYLCWQVTMKLRRRDARPPTHGDTAAPPARAPVEDRSL